MERVIAPFTWQICGSSCSRDHCRIANVHSGQIQVGRGTFDGSSCRRSHTSVLVQGLLDGDVVGLNLQEIKDAAKWGRAQDWRILGDGTPEVPNRVVWIVCAFLLLFIVSIALRDVILLGYWAIRGPEPSKSVLRTRDTPNLRQRGDGQRLQLTPKARRRRRRLSMHPLRCDKVLAQAFLAQALLGVSPRKVIYTPKRGVKPRHTNWR